MTLRTTFLAPVLLVASLVMPSTSHAALTFYNSSAAFTSTLATGSYTETFTGGAGSASSYSFSGGTPAFGYTVTASGGTTVYRDGTFIGNNNSPQALTFTSTTGNISAFGGNFYITDPGDAFLASPVTIIATDSLGATLTQTFTPTGPGINSFGGFTSTGFITSVVMATTSAAGLFNTADNIIVGRVNTSGVVPEPSSLVLCGIASFVGLGVARARRKSAAV